MLREGGRESKRAGDLSQSSPPTGVFGKLGFFTWPPGPAFRAHAQMAAAADGVGAGRITGRTRVRNKFAKGRFSICLTGVRI